MRKIFTILSLIAVTLISTAFDTAGEWFLFKGEGYEVAFPVKPESQTRTIPSQIGELTMSINMYDASKSDKKDDNYVYMTNSTVYPADKISSDKKDNLADVFRGAIDGAVKNVDGKLISEKEIELSGYPGREFKVDFQNGLAVISARCYLVKNRMYIAQVITETKKHPNASMDKFFNSFRIVSAGK